MARPLSFGTKFSGTAHAVLLVWMVAGWGMQTDPLPFDVADVSLVSGADFAAMSRGIQPDLPAGAVPAIAAPALDQTPPAPAPETAPDVAAPPDLALPPAAEMPPAAPQLSAPDTDVSDAPPAVPDTPMIVTPPPSAELGQSARPVPREAPRVAPETITPPDADATVSPDVAQAATDQSDAPIDEAIEPAPETTAPEAASDQIITEADAPEFAPEISRRPLVRPTRTIATPQPQAEPTPEAAPDPVAQNPEDQRADDQNPDTPPIDPVAAALAAAGAVELPPVSPAPTPQQGLGGGDLSDGDKRNILRQIGSCWTLGAVSTAASRTSVTVQFSMEAGGVLDTDSIRMTSFDGGSAADADVIYRAARSALARCPQGQRGDYDVPAEQFQTRRDLQLTFDPTEMGLR